MMKKKNFVVVMEDLVEKKKIKAVFRNEQEFWELLARSDSPDVRSLVIDKGNITPEIITKMLKREKDAYIVAKLIKHYDFKRVPRNIAILSNFPDEKIRLEILDWEEIPSNCLSKMLKKEKNKEAIAKIIAHKNFQRKQKNLKVLLKKWKDLYQDTQEQIASWPEIEPFLKNEKDKS